MPDIKTMIEEILEVSDEICNEWEIDFMENISNQDPYVLSDAQVRVVERIYKKACNSPY